MEDYKNQFACKSADLKNALKLYYTGPVEEFSSPTKYHRMRAEFRIYHEKDSAYYAMTEQKTRRLYRVEQFLIGSKKINQLMPELLHYINEHQILRQKLFCVEFLTSTNGEAVITLIYHKRLDHIWSDKATSIQTPLRACIIGRSRGQKLVLTRDYVSESFFVDDRVLRYRQTESSFTQPNAEINLKLLRWVNKACMNTSGDLVELYCGNCNFTVVLAPKFRNVLATEISKLAVKSGQYNLMANDIRNVTIVRMSSEEISQAFIGRRCFKRLSGVDLKTFMFDTILVDPPRAGLDESTLRLASQFHQIIYISCKPATLVNNIGVLDQTHEVECAAVFDQFPWTEHLEVGVILRKRQCN
ncbi:MAG: tRNA (uridine(54)-C5)-methyltransferase TrmA [Cellvibrionales bacterium TMED49]|nr:tRNA (uridine(54)-C5)-methyltransferase TrmA [Porticoccaceae bacterium]OUU35246.1 MAG: tRNA (uridine(54)-C5)-methyltransferase TrmA [Cellvibrionales bacterium TMED49]